jgi:phenylpropionate dioxygenase-like ring-hydroxylating dioxygenase large terminal subunit
MGILLRRFWLPVMLSTEIRDPDSDPVRLRILSEDLVAFRDSHGRVGLVQARCAHRRAPLFFGRNEEGGLRCVYHGWKFDVDGRCVDMPTEPPESNFMSKVTITAYRVQESGGVVWAYLGPQDRIPDLPRLVFHRVPEGYCYISRRLQHTNYAQAIEGGIDSAHTSYLHTTLDFYKRSEGYLENMNAPSGRGGDQVIALDAKYRTLDKAPRFHLAETEYGLTIAARRTADEATYYWRFNQFLMPFYTMPPRNAGGHAFVPVDDEHCMAWSFTPRTDRPYTEPELAQMRAGGGIHADVDARFRPIRNEDNDYLIDRSMQRSQTFTGIIGTGNQDMAMQEGMGPIVDRTQERLGVTDLGIIGMRQMLLKAARDLQQGVEPFWAQNADAYDVGGVMFLREKDVPFETVLEEAKARMRLEVPRV